jgi:hypothetical protein
VPELEERVPISSAVPMIALSPNDVAQSLRLVSKWCVMLTAYQIA